ncbi:nuclear transport factor 2 family protein [Mucilaginibacter glaciei]|uniref:DUF4440 domain-containing protein n=1 Tax=Mucilaginibacter glaciei TaxID=2772109 RepID=A0A926NV02_9SPHI|nr:hypothetical protein [Mucilaginibacter glaciei]MBD1395077.1 hypothetical protein [Mucilaginibacter glaciei]
MKKINNIPKWITSIAMLLVASMAVAQVPPAGKYDTTSYPDDRKAIEKLIANDGDDQYLNDDYVSVSPDGKVYYGAEAWKQSLKGLKFKSIKPVPGTSILRIYNADAAVRNVIFDVSVITPKGDDALKLIVRETYVKQNGKWHIVGGQGTRMMSQEEQASLSLGSSVKPSYDAAPFTPPAGKYNTTNYPAERKAIEALRMLPDSATHLNDDYIAVGPEGRISYGLKQWQEGFATTAVKFKGVTPLWGSCFMRVYNGDTAVKNIIADVLFDTPKGDQYITVIRTETYIKQNGKWYFVGGQGTRKATAEEKENMGVKVSEKN